MKSAPRIDPRLPSALPSVDDPSESIAEAVRRLGALAESLGLPRPSYERVRQLVQAHRRSSVGRPKREALLDLAFYTGAPREVVAELLSNEP